MTITILFNGRTLAYTEDPELASEVAKQDGIETLIEPDKQLGGVGRLSLNPFIPYLD